MKRNILNCFGAFVLAFFLCATHSCKKDKVDKVEVNNQIALSLFADTVRIGDLLNTLDSSFYQYVRISPEGNISVYYADSITNAVTSDDILGGLNDVTFELNEELEIPSIPPVPVPVPIDIPIENIFSIPFEYEGYGINYAAFKSGKININLSSNFNVLEELTLSTENIKLSDGSDFEISIKLDGNGKQKINIDLADCVVIPVDKKIDFSAKIVATVSEQGIGGLYNFSVDGSIKNLKLKSLDGTIENLVFGFEANNEFSVNIQKVYGDLKVTVPQFSLKYQNSFGFLANGHIDSLYLLCENGSTVDLFEDYPVEILLHSTGNSYDSITDLDDKMVDNIDLLKPYNSFNFKGDVVMGCDNVSENMIDENSHIDIIADFELPLQFNIDNLQFIDTIDFNLTIEESEEEGIGYVEDIFDELEFKFVFNNELPLQIVPQMYMLENGVVIDSLFEAGSFINGNFDGNKTEDVLVVKIKDEKLHNIQVTDKLLLDISLTSLGNNVVINTNDCFDLRIGLKTKTTEVYLDEFNF